MTNAQVAAYRATGAASFQLDPLTLTRSGNAGVLDWLGKQNLEKAPLIYATADPVSVKAAQIELGVAAVGELIERTLAACAVAGRNLGARRIIVAGGETSGAVTKALGVTQLDISIEIAPGVPWTYCTSNGADIALALKSGNFGTETFFTDAQAKLEQL